MNIDITFSVHPVGPNLIFVTLSQGDGSVSIECKSERDAIILYARLLECITECNDCIQVKAHEIPYPGV